MVHGRRLPVRLTRLRSSQSSFPPPATRLITPLQSFHLSGGLSTIRPALPRLVASNARAMKTPPDQLVSTSTFRSSDTPPLTLPAIGEPGPSRPLRQTVLSDCKSAVQPLQLPPIEVQEWQGRVVFADTVPSSSTCHTSGSGLNTPTRISQAQGSERSPISVSSDSSPEKLSRPRGKPIYTTRLSSTAYTPPRPLPPSFETDATQGGASKPVHPFFSRGFVRSRSTPPPPPAARPRFVAHYSSTSASSHSQSQTQTDSQSSTWSVSRNKEIELVEDTIQPYRATSPSEYSGSEGEQNVDKGPRHRSKTPQNREDELDIMMRDLDALSIGKKASRDPGRPVSKLSARRALGTPTQLPVNKSESNTVKKASTSKATARPTASSSTTKTSSNAAPRRAKIPTSHANSHQLESSTSRPAPGWITQQSVLPEPSPSLPPFAYRTLLPAPKVIYTSDPDEANDLLSCLKGDILGFDLEWPMNNHKTPDGRSAGSIWDPMTNKLKFVQPRVALMQFCDEKMVVLVQIWGMKSEQKLPRPARIC